MQMKYVINCNKRKPMLSHSVNKSTVNEVINLLIHKEVFVKNTENPLSDSKWVRASRMVWRTLYIVWIQLYLFL